MPSLFDLYPGADFQEREAWDLMGIKFSGHPDLRRILMWEGFNGHPLQKDWKEAFYVEDDKPFKQPLARRERSSALRTRIPFNKNVEYPEGFASPESWEPEADHILYDKLLELARKVDNGMWIPTM